MIIAGEYTLLPYYAYIHAYTCINSMENYHYNYMHGYVAMYSIHTYVYCMLAFEELCKYNQ